MHPKRLLKKRLKKPDVDMTDFWAGFVFCSVEGEQGKEEVEKRDCLLGACFSFGDFGG